MSVYTDQRGFRTDENILTKRTSSQSVLFLGASWTWGSWVEYNQRFSSIIDASTPTQVINGSCPSHSIYQSFLVAKKLQSESFSSTILIDINMDYSSRIFSYVIPGNF